MIAIRMSEECSECGRTSYDDNSKHLISGDCITGWDADENTKMRLCWDCYPASWEMARDGSGINKFRRVTDG